MKVKDHPFFCYRAGCRKTAWDTPDYLTPEDWAFAERVVAVLKCGTGEQLHDLLWNKNNPPNTASNFFNRVVGWPEGFNYCQEERYTVISAFPGMKRHTLPRLEPAILKRKQNEPSNP